ncbi:hypothetical protein PTKIN_Ptkin13bG0148600 [Pterospermum kingtungense]
MVSYNHVKSKLKPEKDNKEDKDPTQSKDDDITTSQNYVVLVGGNGEGRSSIPSAIVVCHIDLSSNSLSDQPLLITPSSEKDLGSSYSKYLVSSQSPFLNMSVSPTISTLTLTSSGSKTPLITIDAAAQLPIKLNPFNFPSWGAQFNSLLYGHNLYGYIDGSISKPSRLIQKEGSS